MGTRHLTGVIYGGKYRIAQYGQWDGYIVGGQGEHVLEFIKNSDMSVFKKKLDNCKFIEALELKGLYDAYVATLEPNVVSDYDKTEAFANAYPSLTRNTGAKILDIVYNSTDEVLLRDDHDFLTDTVFCEYAYVIDLDKNKLMCYKYGSEKFAEISLDDIPTAEELEERCFSQG